MDHLYGCFSFLGFLIIIQLVPLTLNLSRSYYTAVVIVTIVQLAVTILTFTFHYQAFGLLRESKAFTPTFTEALYFSVTTFTTLGYGDLQPLPAARLVTSVEALAGMISVAITAAIIWLWCQENLIPKEMAVLDGNRRAKGDMAIGRLRVKTVTGKERQLKNWVPPPKPGEVFQYDSNREEWIEVSHDEELPEKAPVIDAKERHRPK